MQDQIYDLLVQKDEVTWQSLIYELVKTDQLNPWNIDISVLTKRYLETVKKMKEHNFFISGKVLLASAILLKVKSNKLVEENLMDFDNMLFPREEDLLEDQDYEIQQKIRYDAPELLIKTPQQRKKQLTLNDLMEALEKALNVEENRKIRAMDRVIAEAVIPEKTIDITKLLAGLYEKIVNMFSARSKLTFSELVNSEKKEDKIITFIPLLHLDAQQKVDLSQERAFGEIDIKVP